jgi:hypothetical protein
MSNIFNSKKKIKTTLLTNIRVIKIIAIVLGCLIIVSLVALFLGLANSYKNIEKLDQNTEIISNKNVKELNQFVFSQPFNAQLISSSLGEHNQILLRYLYKGNNVLVILDTNTTKIISIVTIKKESIKW